MITISEQWVIKIMFLVLEKQAAADGIINANL